jgi:hypothetical protein
MGNIKTCVDTSRTRSTQDDEILDEKFNLIDEARKYLFDHSKGEFRTMAQAMELAKENKK